MHRKISCGTFCVLVALLCACSTEPSKPRTGKTPPSTTETEPADAEVRTQTTADVIVPEGIKEWERVTFKFAGPDADSDHERGDITFAIDPGNFAVGSYGLFYNRAHHSLEGANPIAEDLDPDVREVVWDTTDLEPGTYFVFAILKYEESLSVRFFPGSLNLLDDVGGNRPPFVQLLNGLRENNGRIGVFQPGESINLNIVAVDPEKETMTFELLFSEDGGDTWTSLGDVTDQMQAQGDPSLGRFQLPFTMPDLQGEARLRLEVMDESGNVGQATTKAFFIGTPPPDDDVDA